ncbi:MAG TPA: histidine phosphatase family protein [Dermatophilaceae bacterium]|nr:histidine phosphatase family protein [Dermatophilaceae bacterium]
MLWARHGRNEANVSRTFSHRKYDTQLTERGRSEAEFLAGEIQRSDEQIASLVCSPMNRARATAQIIAQRLGLTIDAELDDLRELNVGDLDGRNDAEAWAVYERVLQAWRHGRPEVRFPGGEDLHELCARLDRAFQAIDAMTPQGTALVIAHGSNLRAALPRLAGINDPGYDLPTGACAILSTVPHTFGSISLVAWPTRPAA